MQLYQQEGDNTGQLRSPGKVPPNGSLSHRLNLKSEPEVMEPHNAKEKSNRKAEELKSNETNQTHSDIEHAVPSPGQGAWLSSLSGMKFALDWP